MLEPLLRRKLRNLFIQSRIKVTTFLQGHRRSVFLGPGTEYADLREYVPGDDLRRVDWRATARRPGNLIVREYEVERNVNVFVAIDTSQSMLLGEGSPRIRSAILAAAALGQATIGSRDFFGIGLFSSDIDLFLPPRGGRRHLYSALSKAIGVIPSGTTTLGSSIREVAGKLKRRSIIIVITDLHDNFEETIKGFRAAVSRGHDIHVIHISDPLEYVFPGRLGKVKIFDPSQKDPVVIDLSDPIERGIYYEALIQEIENMRNFVKTLRSLRIRVVEASTKDVVDQILLTYYSAKRRGKGSR